MGPSTLRIDLDALAEGAINHGGLVSALQHIWFILDSFRINDNLGTMADLDDILALDYNNDGDMTSFRHQWRHLISNLRANFPPDEIRDVLYQKLRASRLNWLSICPSTNVGLTTIPIKRRSSSFQRWIAVSRKSKMTRTLKRV